MIFSLISRYVVGIINKKWWICGRYYMELTRSGPFRCGGPFCCGALDCEIECQEGARLRILFEESCWPKGQNSFG
jgi:hypothetical protein